MTRWHFVTLLFALFLSSCPIFSQDLDSLLKLSAFTAESDLQKQLNQATGIGSGKAVGTRETPGILSVVTAEDIRNMGARDITDIIRTVPGFDIGQDVQFVTGVSFRGNWANEGKVLFLLDGQQVNELLYQTVPLLNNFPVDAIEKIEIIRGPGSAVYGGSAEYAVINIITRQASSLNGIKAYGTMGLHSNVVGWTNAGVMLAQNGKKMSWDFGFFQGKGIVSDRSGFVDSLQISSAGAYPVSNLATATAANPMNINAGFRAKGLQVRGMYMGYNTNDPVNFTKYDNYSADIKYDIKFNSKLTVTPQYIYMNQVPWSWGTVSDGNYALKARATRNLANVTANYNFSRKVNLVAGLVYFTDKANDLLPANTYFGGQDFNLYNYALFAQGLIKHRLANITLGARYEKNNRAGDAFVPRLALTKKVENFHFKLLYSQAFRSPAIENLHLAIGKVVPEKSNVGELELGYQFTPEMLFSVNAFVLSTNNVIVYQFTTNNVEGYQNFSKSGSRGIELVYSLRKKKWNANVNYSFAQAASNSTVDNYKTPQTNSQFVGIPAQKAVAMINHSISARFSANVTLIYSGKRYAYTKVDSGGTPFATTLDPYVLTNFFVNYESQGFVIGLGAYDLFNQRPAIPQMYNGNYAPIPGRSREFVVKISCQLNFKK
ncbi:MAG TPA: TonB-dependent receptor plug domain-containing protein [Cyclobacteriaceae bacterium]|nr:TonB-dependent receptor plug domain-containing protein [Cyclobacteriaceae bacterium]